VRRWRGLDLGTTRVFLQADAPRVRCAEHGVTVAALLLTVVPNADDWVG
jgi:transposase